MLRDYFSDKDFIQLYLHKFLHSFGISAMYIYTGAFFLLQGMPLHYVILFFGFEFGLRGLLCPHGLYLFKKLGMVKALILAMISKSLFFIIIANEQSSLTVSFASFILCSFGGAIYYPFKDVLEAIVIQEDTHRGRQYSFSLVSGLIAKFLGALVTAYLIGQYSFLYASVLLSISLLASIFPLLSFDQVIDYQKDYRPIDLCKYLATPQFLEYLPAFFGEQLVVIMNFVMAPLFLYAVIGDIEFYGYVVASAIAFQAIVILVFGHFIDQKGYSKSLHVGFHFILANVALHSFFVTGKLTVFLARTVGDLSYSIYSSSLVTNVHSSLQKLSVNKMLFGAAWQMSLCLGELIVLPLLAIIAYFFGHTAFYVSFVFAAIGAFLSFYLPKKD